MSALNANSDNENLLKAILTGAFYPRIARIQPPGARFEKIQAGALVKEVYSGLERAVIVAKQMSFAARSQGSQVLRPDRTCVHRTFLDE